MSDGPVHDEQEVVRLVAEFVKLNKRKAEARLSEDEERCWAELKALLVAAQRGPQ